MAAQAAARTDIKAVLAARESRSNMRAHQSVQDLDALKREVQEDYDAELGAFEDLALDEIHTLNPGVDYRDKLTNGYEDEEVLMEELIEDNPDMELPEAYEYVRQAMGPTIFKRPEDPIETVKKLDPSLLLYKHLLNEEQLAHAKLALEGA